MRWFYTIKRRELKLREWTLLLLAISTVVIGALLWYWIVPTWERWSALAAQTNLRRKELAELERNVAMRDSVEGRFAELSSIVLSKDSDQIVLSNFLRDIEAAARHPSLTLINMTPQAVEDHGVSKRYPVRLALAGTPQDVLKFVSQVLHGSAVVGLDSFAMRGVQGDHAIECTLVLWMARLVDRAPSTTRRYE